MSDHKWRGRGGGRTKSRDARMTKALPEKSADRGHSSFAKMDFHPWLDDYDRYYKDKERHRERRKRETEQAD